MNKFRLLLKSTIENDFRIPEAFSAHPSLANEMQAAYIVPKQMIVVLVVLALVVTAWTLDSILHPGIANSDLNNVAVMIAKDIDPSLYPTDYAFADSKFYQAYTPFYRWLIYFRGNT